MNSLLILLIVVSKLGLLLFCVSRNKHVLWPLHFGENNLSTFRYFCGYFELFFFHVLYIFFFNLDYYLWCIFICITFIQFTITETKLNKGASMLYFFPFSFVRCSNFMVFWSDTWNPHVIISSLLFQYCFINYIFGIFLGLTKLECYLILIPKYVYGIFCGFINYIKH